jgi:hypothetical protein
MSLTARLRLIIDGIQSASRDLGTTSAPFTESATLSFTDGVGNSQADRVWTDQRTLAASATEDLDLAAVLVDAISGAALTFATIKAVIVKAAAGNTNNVNVSRPASNGVPLFAAAGDLIAVKPGGLFAWACPNAGVAVTPATGDLLTITNSGAGTPVTFDIILIGTST